MQVVDKRQVKNGGIGLTLLKISPFCETKPRATGRQSYNNTKPH